jgi:hypothetical protein
MQQFMPHKAVGLQVGMRLQTKYKKQNSVKKQNNNWFDGAEGEWRLIKNIQARRVDASATGNKLEMRRLQRALLRVFHRGLEKSKYKGRLLGALGDCFNRPDQKLRTLLESYAKSIKERDPYNCLLVADSLAEFYVETRFNQKNALYWIRRARTILKRYPDSYRKNNLQNLTEKLMVRTLNLKT